MAPRCRPERRVVFSSTGDLTRRTKVFGPPGKGFVALLGAAAESLFATVFPSACRFCGVPLARISRMPVCDACLSNIRPLQDAFCAICGQILLAAGSAEGRCGECLRREPPYARAVAYGSYSGALRDLIHLLKYERVRPAAGVLGRMLAETAAVLVADFGKSRPVVVPVPLHPSKERQRGFNQSELIARAAVKILDARLPLNRGALIRRRATGSQTGLSRPQRRLNLRGAFEVVRPADIAGRDVLLVDDVFTTGTTVSECTRVLRRAGAGRVWVATVARVMQVNVASVPLPADAVDEGEGESGMMARGAQA